jgi:hypothetical protein
VFDTITIDSVCSREKYETHDVETHSSNAQHHPAEAEAFNDNNSMVAIISDRHRLSSHNSSHCS